MSIFIETKYTAPTNTGAGRIRCKNLATGRTSFYPYDHALHVDDVHAAAAKRHIERFHPQDTWTLRCSAECLTGWIFAFDMED